MALRIAQALADARALGLARLDAQWLLGHVLRRPRSWLLAHDDECLDEEQRTAWATLLARRAAGEPLAYVVGECEFRGLRLTVTPAVLIPRPETELLVEWALSSLDQAPSTDVVDLGTGSGAIALALRRARSDLHITATDASAAALAVARANAARLGLPLHLANGDWWQAVTGQRFGLAVSNPPYIAAGDPHLAALQHEPQAALTPGGDGLDALRHIIDDAPAHLLGGAWLLLEHGHDQAEAVGRLLHGRGFAGIRTRTDLAGLPRCTAAVWPAGGDR